MEGEIDMNTKKVRWGIIGCGDVTEVKSGPAFYKLENSELVAVMRRSRELAKDYAERHGVAKWYDNADALINDPEVDAVYIATPPNSHKAYTIKVAEAGKPVYVEKPMALNFEECQEMIAACKKAGVPLFTAYYRRALESFVKIKDLLNEGLIGDIRFVSVKHYQKASESLTNAWRTDPAVAGGGLLFDLGSHTLDVLDYLLGPIKEAKGFSSNQAGSYAAEDIVSGTFLFESGVHGVGNWCFSANEDIEVNEIVGSKGKIVFSTFNMDSIKLVTESETKEFNFNVPEHIQQPLIEKIVNDLLGNGVSPSIGESAARTNWIMDKLINRIS